MKTVMPLDAADRLSAFQRERMSHVSVWKDLPEMENSILVRAKSKYIYLENSE